MDFDQLGAMHVLAKGVDFSENGQAMEAFHQVEPGGHFLGCAHTQANFETAFYRSNIADNNSVEQWREEGSKDAATRANALMEVDAGRIRAAAARPGQGRGDPRVHRQAQGVDAGRDLLIARPRFGAYGTACSPQAGRRRVGSPLPQAGERREVRASQKLGMSMRTHARAVVIGGGVVGVSTLYHLAKKGWSDSVLVERKELTSGSTWHAAGLLPLFNLSYSVGQIHKYSVALYKTLEKETGLDVGLRQVSNIRLARTRDRMDEYHYYAGVAATIGVKVKFLTPQEVKEIWPLCNVEGIIGAIQHPEDGYIQPADLTQALGARRARARRRDQPPYDRDRDRAAAERRMEGRRPTRATSSASTSSRRPAISRGRPAAWSGSTCR